MFFVLGVVLGIRFSSKFELGHAAGILGIDSIHKAFSLVRSRNLHVRKLVPEKSVGKIDCQNPTYVSAVRVGIREQTGMIAVACPFLCSIPVILRGTPVARPYWCEI